MAAGDIPRRKAALSKLTAIIGELQNTLDLDRGGQLAVDLERLYGWAMHRLLDAVVARDPAPIDEVKRMLETLRGRLAGDRHETRGRPPVTHRTTSRG